MRVWRTTAGDARVRGRFSIPKLGQLCKGKALAVQLSPERAAAAREQRLTLECVRARAPPPTDAAVSGWGATERERRSGASKRNRVSGFSVRLGQACSNEFQANAIYCFASILRNDLLSRPALSRREVFAIIEMESFRGMSAAICSRSRRNFASRFCLLNLSPEFPDSLSESNE